MLHLRVVCPSTDTEPVLRLLRAEPGVAHPIVVRGVADEADGDVVAAEIARESAAHVLDGLGELGVPARGEASLTALDTVRSEQVDRAERAAPGPAADALIWDELVATTGEESRLSGVFLAFLTVACLLAAVGVITDSPVTIVGAMVVGPEFGPLAALAVAIAGSRSDLAARAGRALLVGFPVASLVTTAFALLARVTGLFHPADLTEMTAVAFVYQIGPYSVIVALLAGVAGMLALTSEKSGVLVGVFISVTTVPAAGFSVLAAVAGAWPQSGEALLQLLINLGGITVAATLTLLVRRHHVLPIVRPATHGRTRPRPRPRRQL